MIPRSWFVISHVKTITEIKVLNKDLKRCQQNLNDTTDVYWIDIRKSNATIYHICNDIFETINIILKKITESDEKWLIKIINYILNITKIDGVLYYGHGYGYGISLCNMDIVNFIQIIIKPLQPYIVCFDACYMGDIILLYEISPFVRYVIANSSFHPWNSITSLTNFGKLSNITIDKISDYMKNIITEFNNNIPNNYKKMSCLIGFDTKYINYINNIKFLDFSNQQHLPYDKYRYNLLNGIQDNDIKKKLTKVIITSLDTCSSECNGISISLLYTHKQYKLLNLNNTRWFKDLYNKIKIIVKYDKNIKQCFLNINNKYNICNIYNLQNI